MKKILLVEDDPFLIEMYQNKFVAGGLEVVTAEDGENALRKIEKEYFDLLVLDIIMPKLNGFEVLRKLRQHQDQKKAQVPVVILTNLEQKSDMDQSLELGANDYIIKADFTPSEILNKIKNLLNK